MTGSGKTDQLAQPIIFTIYIPDDKGKCGCLDKAKELDSEHQILQRGSRKTVDTCNYKVRKKIYEIIHCSLDIALYYYLLQLVCFPRACHL